MIDINKLSLKEKIGQIIHCGFSGTEANENITELVSEYGIGGIIFFGRNIESRNQIFELTKKLQSYAKIPLLTGIDQEGGMVVRIEKDFATSPGSMAIAAAGSVEYAEKLAYNTGIQLNNLGLNMNYAPVIDVNNNHLNPVIGVRSFGDEPNQVSKYGNATVDGYKKSKVVAVVKHFPGHGDTNADSHLGMPIIAHDIERINEIELVPFKEAIKNDVDAIMISHVSFPAIDDSNVPATLSKKVITDLLRDTLGFDGVAMTDCMEMKAIIDQYGMEEATILAVEAGNDAVLISHTYKYQVEALEGLYNAVKSGRVSEDTINKAVIRNLKLKEKLDFNEENKIDMNIDEQQKFAEKVSQESISMLNKDDFTPITKKDAVSVFWTNVKVWVEVDELIDQESTLGSALKNRNINLEEFVLQTDPSKEEQNEYLKNVKEILKENSNHKFVITTYNATHNKGQVDFVNTMLKLTENVIVVALRNPYDIMMFENLKTYIMAYESKNKAIESVANILVGDKKATGKCPVKLTN